MRLLPARRPNPRAAVTILASSLLVCLAGWSAFRLHVRPDVPPASRPAGEEGIDTTGRSGALLALDFWSAARAYPGADIPPGAFSRAWRQRDALLSRTAGGAAEDGSAWYSIGPTNVAGRMLSVAIDPFDRSTLYAGSASGGLWRSTTSGLGGDWIRVVTGHPVLGVGAIALDPVTPGVMYIGTGEVYRYQWSVGGTVQRTTRGSYGIGILKSVNAGATWTRSLDWTQHDERAVQALCLNPRNHLTVFAATTEGVYRSPDAGASWQLVLPVIMARDVAVDAGDTTRVLATAGNFGSAGAGVYRSTNGGFGFARIDTLPAFTGYARLEPWPAEDGVCYLGVADSTVSSGSIWRTADFGATWSRVNDDPLYGNQGWYAHFVAVHPVDSARIVLGAVDLFRSVNGGVSFTEPVFTWYDNHAYAHDPVDPDILYIANDGGVWRSPDFGASWTHASGGLVTSQFYNGFSNSRQDTAFALGQTQDHYGFMYTGSPAWGPGGVDEAGWTAISPANDSIMYAVERLGRRLRMSTDRGQSFGYLTPGGSLGLACWNTPVVVSNSDPRVIYFGREKIPRSDDGGATWTLTHGGLSLDGNPPLSMAISATSPDTVFVGTAPYVARARVFRTGDRGDTWTDVTGSLPNRYPMDIAIDAWNSRRVFVVFGGYGTGHVYRTLNAGLSWTNITGSLPDVPATAVLLDPGNPGHIYVGTDAGVYLSRDSGASWEVFDQGLPDAVNVADLTLSLANRKLRLATHGNGVFERSAAAIVATGVPGGEEDPGALAGDGDARQGVPADPAVIIASFAVSPNPVSPSRTAEPARAAFELRRPARVSLEVHDVAGRRRLEVAARDFPQGPGALSLETGRLAPGIYVCTLRAGAEAARLKFTVRR